MARRHWTFLVMSEDQSSVRQFSASGRTIRTVIGGGLALLSVLLILAIGFFIKEGQRLRAERLAKENRLLEQEVENIRGQLASLEDWMDELAERDRRYRLVAGLDPIDEDVQQAGIGGPGTETIQSSELWRTNRELGELTFSTAYDLNTLIRRAQLLARSWGEATNTLDETHRRWAHTPSILPTKGYISSSFSRSRWHPILHRARPHEGIDISAPVGTPIVAAANGRVVRAGRYGQFGKMVEIDHGYGVVTRYAHTSELLVKKNDIVERGDLIAKVGQTGLAAGPHLHYEVLVNGRPVNPRRYILNTEVIPD